MIADAQLQRMLDEAAKRGADEALARIGLSDEGSAKDIGDLRELLVSWREVRSAALKTAAKTITILVISVLLLGLGIKLEANKWLG